MLNKPEENVQYSYNSYIKDGVPHVKKYSIKIGYEWSKNKNKINFVLNLSWIEEIYQQYFSNNAVF